ncbi:hypothetical protein LZC95_21455 [Pendulispora brunnea]|uniref:Uncharacterized protein n=1 Tax=Pendulispora brunnea TaxID=2905690 RepID=A0ABZ2KLH8_9BACT
MTTRHHAADPARASAKEVLRATMPRHTTAAASARTAVEGATSLLGQRLWLLAVGLCALGVAALWRSVRRHAA